MILGDYYINDKGFYKKSYRRSIYIIVLSVALLFSAIFGTVQSCKLHNTTKQLGVCTELIGQYRDAESRFDEYERNVETSVEQLENGIERSKDILCGQANTIRDLREVLQQLRTEYESMEKLVNRLRANNSDFSDNNSCSN